MEYALIGFGIGVITTAPVGPVNVMAIQHAAQRGFRQGLFVGLGAVCADTIYAAVAVFGVSAITQFIEGQFDLIKVVGGALLILVGLKVWNTHMHLERDPNAAPRNFLADMAAAFFMALTNPGTVLAFAAIFGGLGDLTPDHDDHASKLIMVAGVAGGAVTWWASVSGAVTRFRGNIDDTWLDRANRIAGAILVVFGLVIYADLALNII
nr:LysE family transporter [Roseibium sp. RKSG952]